jgi:hypothetical protein
LTVEKRLGVPVAGNYLDEVLARLIHRLLSDSKIVDPTMLKYEFHVVGRSPHKDPVAHRVAIIYLWNGIRKAKHDWSRACRQIFDSGGNRNDLPPLIVRVGEVGGGVGLLQALDREKIKTIEEPTDEPGLGVENNQFIYLSIPARLIDSDERMSKFMDFATEEVIYELLDSAGIPAKDINTVIVSGRGALYPELREKVWQLFPKAETPDLLTNDAMKSAVVLGAIARQDLSRVFTDASDQVALAPQLGVLINDGGHLVLEEDWDKPIDLTASPTFRLVQINLKNPNPRQDMKSLRKHFYIDLTDHDFVRDDILGDDKHLCIRKEIRDGELAIYLEGKDGENSTPVFTEGQIAKTATTPPWPVGNVLLDPQE